MIQSAPLNNGCKHNLLVNEMCGDCGMDLHLVSKRSRPSHLVLMGRNTKLQMTNEFLKKKINDNSNHLLKTQKLLLILDIDHTLVHAMSDRSKTAKTALFQKDLSQEIKNEIFNFSLCDAKNDYLVKLRPGVKKFLEALAPMFDLRVYTMGIRPYAEKILEVIDPEHKLIRKRCVCRDDFDDEKRLYKNHHRLFPVKKNLVVVVDDRVDVWKKIARNVVQVPKFLFFGVNSNLDAKSSVMTLRNKDNVLQTVQNKLIAIHSSFYRGSKGNPIDKFNLTVDLLKPFQNCAKLIKVMQKNVLKGVKIVFSGIFPAETIIENTSEWKLAKSLGAKCVKTLSVENTEGVTHVVGLSKTTEKTGLGLAIDGIEVVTVYWLYHCKNHFCRAPEEEFRFENREENASVICWNSKIPTVKEFEKCLKKWSKRKEKKEVKKCDEIERLLNRFL